MFSGIIERTGRVLAMQPHPGGARLRLDLGASARGLKAGDSIAVNGVCLTAVAPRGGRVSFDLITETLRKTNLGQLKKGSQVNIERSLRPSDRLEGHFVQGHVQGVATLIKQIVNKKDFKLIFTPPKELLAYCAPLGCIAVNGVSLTIAAVDKKSFTVALIPTTLKLTNLGDLKVGDKANLETDLIARQLVHWLKLRHTKTYE